VADDDPGAQCRHRDAGLPEQLLDLVAAAQVRRQVVLAGPEAAQVDDAGDALVRRGPPERGRTLGVALFEVGVAEGVHEVEGHLAAGERGPQRRRVADVAGHRLAHAPVARRAPGHRPHRVPGALERGAQPGADEAGRARHQHLHEQPRAVIVRGLRRAGGAPSMRPAHGAVQTGRRPPSGFATPPGPATPWPRGTPLPHRQTTPWR
jgi:hypothetical protein